MIYIFLEKKRLTYNICKHSVKSDQGLHCLPITHLKVSRLKRDKDKDATYMYTR